MRFTIIVQNIPGRDQTVEYGNGVLARPIFQTTSRYVNQARERMTGRRKP